MRVWACDLAISDLAAFLRCIEGFKAEGRFDENFHCRNFQVVFCVKDSSEESSIMEEVEAGSIKEEVLTIALMLKRENPDCVHFMKGTARSLQVIDLEG